MPKWVKKILKTEEGFTLIELIFVVIIIAVLAGIALVNMGASEDDAKTAIVKADLRMLATAIKVYKAKEGEFPESLDALLHEGPKGYKPLLEALPIDPYAKITEEDKTTDYNYSKTAIEATVSSDKSGAEFSKSEMIAIRCRQIWPTFFLYQRL